METQIIYKHLAETDSTSKAIVEMESECPQGGMLVLWADYQSAGRGQKGNKWVSERGSNLLFSVLLRPQGVEVDRQFRLSEAMALAEAGAINELLDSVREKGSNIIKIKWPNDLYYGYRKLGGTIIETTLRGKSVERCVLGMGINVNQTVFDAAAPNPVSLKVITGREWDREALLQSIMKGFVKWLRMVEQGDDEVVAAAYRRQLLWAQGWHSYIDKVGAFTARLVDILADGQLILEDTNGQRRTYMFKEVKHVFPSVVSE